MILDGGPTPLGNIFIKNKNKLFFGFNPMVITVASPGHRRTGISFSDLLRSSKTKRSGFDVTKEG